MATGGLLWVTFGRGKPVPIPAYTALRVIDGDTFETTEHQHIRLASTEAPELDRCGGPEAKAALEKMIMGKPLVLKVTFNDQFKRLVSVVYTDEGFVNEKMLRQGYAYFNRGVAEFNEVLTAATEKARDEKLGIFSETCTQVTNPKNAKCNIKGNDRNGKIYYTPDCGEYYNITTVQLYLGDLWFCSEKEAIAEGFRKPERCP